MIDDLDACRWTGRKGYGNRTLIGACLVKYLLAFPTWTWTVAAIKDNEALQNAIGGLPSEAACYRFARKLRTHATAGAAFQKCLDQLLLGIQLDCLRKGVVLGERVALDATDIPAYANGQRWLHQGGPLRERFADPDASWGHRSATSTRPAGGFYGFKLHLGVCVETGIPLVWEPATGRGSGRPEDARSSR